MAEVASILTQPLSRGARVVGIPLAAFLLTLFFILLGFPYHHLTDRATAFASRALGVEITAADSGLSPGLDGPGFRFGSVRIETPSGEVYRVDRARFGPAWSLSWFSLTPTVFYEIESALGSTAGKLRLDDSTGWAGDIVDADLDALEFVRNALPVKLTGSLSATGDIAGGEAGYTGPLEFRLRKGILAHEAFPLEIPFESLDGVVRLGDAASGPDLLAEIERISMIGPMFRLNVAGTVGRGEPASEAPLDLRLELSEVQREIRSMIEPFGVRIDAEGRGSMRIGGTFGNPTFP